MCNFQIPIMQVNIGINRVNEMFIGSAILQWINHMTQIMISIKSSSRSNFNQLMSKTDTDRSILDSIKWFYRLQTTLVEGMVPSTGRKLDLFVSLLLFYVVLRFSQKYWKMCCSSKECVFVSDLDRLVTWNVLLLPIKVLTK